MHSIIPQNTYIEKNVYRLIHLTDKKDKEQTSKFQTHGKKYTL